jgi:hypothetical protein
MSDNAPPMPPDGGQPPLPPSKEPSADLGTPLGRESALQVIPKNYKQAGYFMSLLKREGNAAMYADASKTYFEVHRVRTRKAEHAFGKDYPEREVLASNEDFGIHAWACVNIERAEFRFANIVAESKS